MEALIPTLSTPPTPDYSACFLIRFHAFFFLIILGYYDLPVIFVNACHSPCSILCLSGSSYNSVFVLCCCVTNEPKIKWLKTHFFPHNFFRVRLPETASWSLLFQGLSQATIKAPEEARAGSASQLRGWLQAAVPRGGWTETFSHHWPITGGSSRFLAM